jgi:hypothetical protein
MRKNIALAAALGFLASGTLASVAQAATITLDGTSGSNIDGNAYSTTGNLDVSLGFFVEHLIVGGGGGGSRWGGGGAGGLITSSMQLFNLNYPITVGAGGTGVNSGSPGGNGGDSTAFGLTAVGGGGGALYEGVGQNGGSGGGGGASDTGAKSGGTGTAGQGNAGGSGGSQGSTTYPAGGGGGAGSSGGNSVGGTAGSGGTGLSSSITGIPLFYAGGGGGGAAAGTAGIGGSGVGGNGGKSEGITIQSTAGMDNRGGGGGGASSLAGYSAGQNRGGSGIVIARYLGTPAGTGGTVSAGSGSATGYTLHTFTTVGASALDLSALDLSARLGVTLTTGITGTGDLNFNGPGELTLAANNSYAGATNVNVGTLALSHASSNNIASSDTIRVASGAFLDVTGLTGGNLVVSTTQTLAGSGTVTGAVTIGGGATISPGDSPGTLFTGAEIWNPAGNYLFEINDATGTAGSDPGWDLLDIAGSLTINSSRATSSTSCSRASTCSTRPARRPTS